MIAKEALVSFVRRENWRLVATVVTASIMTVAVGRALRAPKARASASFNSNYPASAAVDGATGEWLLPDKTAGWLDLYLSPYRHVRRLHLVNARNRPFADRGALAVKVEVYFDEELRQTHALTFEGAHSEELDIEIGVAADRIRVTVETWTGLSGGLAEVEVL